MALINDREKYIFFHLYKCGGNSMRELLCGNEVQSGHSLPIDFEKLDKQKFDSYFKFTIIRNPYDFVLSTYFYGKTFTNHFVTFFTHIANVFF